MTNAFANSPLNAFEDEFDLDTEFLSAPPAALSPGALPQAPMGAPAQTAFAPQAPAAFATPQAPTAPVQPPILETAPAPLAPTPVAPAPAYPVQAAQVPADPAPVYAAPATHTEPTPPITDPAAVRADVSIPRIAIHVFAERQDTLASAERAGQDRRMSRATTHIRGGGVPAAVQAYQHEPTPPLIVVECLADPATLLAQVDALAEVCDAGTKVIVVGATNDILLFRELMRRGVSEYLVAPIQPLQLIAAIGGLFSDPSQPFVGRTIAFVGARGGAGASAVAHNTAYAISERIGANSVIVDYDLPFGTAGLDFNQDPLNGVADALGQPDRLDATLLDRMMVRCTDKLSLFAAPATLDNDWDISAEAFEEVTGRIRGTAPFVILDIPHLWSPWVRRTLITADEVVVVATPDLASLRNAKNMIDLIRQGRPNDAPPRLVLNQVGLPGRPEIPTKDFGAALGVHPSLVIPFDAKLFGAAANNGQMIIDAAAKSKAAEAFQTLAQIVTQRELPQTPGKGAKPAKAAPAAKAESKSLLAGLFRKG